MEEPRIKKYLNFKEIIFISIKINNKLQILMSRLGGGFNSPRGGYHSPRGGYYHGGGGFNGGYGGGFGGFGAGLALGALTGAALAPGYGGYGYGGYGYGSPYYEPVYAPPHIIIPTTASNVAQLAAANPSYPIQFIPAQSVYTSPRVVSPQVINSPVYYR